MRLAARTPPPPQFYGSAFVAVDDVLRTASFRSGCGCLRLLAFVFCKDLCLGCSPCVIGFRKRTNEYWRLVTVEKCNGFRIYVSITISFPLTKFNITLSIVSLPSCRFSLLIIFCTLRKDWKCRSRQLWFCFLARWRPLALSTISQETKCLSIVVFTAMHQKHSCSISFIQL